MNRNIDNIDDLARALMPSLKGMVDAMANRVYETLNFFLQKYYNSYEPEYYRRQYDFLRSAIKVDAKIVRGKVVAAVYIDTASMDNYYQATGLQVAVWANEGLHGGLNVGRKTLHVWDDTMANTVEKGQLLKEAVAYLKSKGFNVKTN